MQTHAEYQGRLRILQPTKWLPRRLGPIGDARMLRSLRRWLTHLAWTRPVLWVNDPNWAHLVSSTGWPSLYDITDDWVQAARGEREHRRLETADATLLARCDEVVVCSVGLSRAKGATRPVTLIPNGVDVERYRHPYDRPPDLPDASIALYAGTLHEDRLDLDLVLKTAALLAENGGRLVLLGPDSLSTRNTGRLEASPGVLLLGPRPRQDVPAYLQHADALVVPHLVDDFTDSLDPIKLYEYRAVGRPIVSTPVAGFRDFAGEPGVEVAAAESFATAVLLAVREPVPTGIRAQVADWSERGQAMRAVIDRLEARRPAAAQIAENPQ